MGSGRFGWRPVALIAMTLLSSCLAAGAAPAWQAEQTRDGAQTFIAKALTQGGGAKLERRDPGMPDFNSFEAKIEFCNGRTCQGSEIVRRRNPAFGISAVNSGRDKDICYTSIEHYGLDDAPRQEGTNILSWYNPPRLESPEIEWNKVAEVKVDGATVVVTNSAQRLKFVLPSDAMAARLGYAMEFLRVECDGLGATGF